MAVADDLQRPSATEFDRQPPQDFAAEQSVLGGMLLSKDAIADVIETLKGSDFYRPAHQLVYETIVDLYARGEPADPVTVSSALSKSGNLLRVGGAPYLHTLISSVPTAANAGYYATIVAERAILRRLVEAGTRIVQLGYGAASGRGGEVDEIVDRAQAEVYDVTERRLSEDYVILEKLLQGTMDEIDAISSRGGVSLGIKTGFEELDEKTHGLHPGQLVLVAARPALGKALALDTALPTPTGWTTMGAVAVGDWLLGADGRPTRVVAATDVMVDRPCFEVEFSDGTVITADADHQWRTSTRAARRAASERKPPSYYWAEPERQHVRELLTVASGRPDEQISHAELRTEVGQGLSSIADAGAREVLRSSAEPHRGAARGRCRPRRLVLTELDRRRHRVVNAGSAMEHNPIVTTGEIARTLHCADGRPNHAVAVALPLSLHDVDLPVPPYMLGAWLGDGNSAAARITTEDREIVTEIESEGIRVVSTGNPLNFSLQLPPRTAASRSCDVCGQAFMPKTSQIRTCGGRVRGVTPPMAPPSCSDCGLPSSGGALCRACRLTHGSVQAILRSIGVLGNKHIPKAYLRASEAQRRSLLAGLLDTDGYVNREGNVEFAVTSQRLAMDTRELVTSLGYRVTMTTNRVRGRSEGSSTAYRLHFTPREPVFRLRKKLERQIASGPRVSQRYVVDVRAVSSVPVRCVQVDNDDHMYLSSRSMIPTHNSTLALDIARNCSIKHGLTAVIFSLEMSKSEITMRLLSAEAKVPLHHMRSGHMNDDDWTKLGRRMGEVADAPLFIDDSPNLTMMEIRAKSRRLKQRHDLRLVIVDYLQLMTSGRKVESRQQEVSEFSRQLKLLAKELDVPVIAVCQLNRGPEQRQDKKPMLSDLRESGCLAGSTRILRADTGVEVTIGSLFDSGERDVPVWSLDDRLRLVPKTMTHAFSSGVKEVFRLRLTSGREIEATANHPFLTMDGWMPLRELTVGSRLGVPRHVSAPLSTATGSDEHVLGLADLVASAEITEASVPAEVFAFGTRHVRLFLRHVWGTLGVAEWDKTSATCRLSIELPQRRVVDDLARLLLRCNVMTRVQGAFDGAPGWRLSVSGAEQQLRFLDEIGLDGAAGADATDCAARLRVVTGQAIPNTIPTEVWSRIRGVLHGREALNPKAVTPARTVAGAPDLADLAKAAGPSSFVKPASGRERLGKVAALLDDAAIDIVATNDIFWDAVAEIASLGEQDTYDATVPGTQNFVANGIAVHNSLEQDADVVLLIHREDFYEPESPRAGEADLLVVKHRNGPTGTVTVAFQGHYSRFVDMAR